MSALKYWLWLSGCEVSAKAKAALFRYYGDAQQAFMAPKGDYRMVEGISPAEREILEKRDLFIADRIYGECQRQFLDIITYQDARYPKRLRNIYAPPAVLYLKGKLPNIDENAAIAVVGTRKASVYGIRMARNMANDIARCGAIVVSGLTRGIDGAAAEGALLADGIVVAVLGTSHEKDKNFLSPDVAVRGAVISEYPPTREMRNSFFRERNRISAGLSVGVLAVEAPENSGTALFVEEAVEQGKEIFAVPSNVDSVNSVGTLNMLKDGAKLVTCGYDVVCEFEYLFPGKLHPPKGGSSTEKIIPAEAEKQRQNGGIAEEETKKVIDKENDRGYIDLKEQLSKLNETQLKIITAIDANASHIDDIIEATGLPTATVLAQLTVLEIKGYVRREAGKRITLNTAKK